MRTIVDIPDHTFRRLKTRAASEGISAKKLILRGIEQLLMKNCSKVQLRVRLPIVQSKRPGKVHLTNAKIYEVISVP
jgi:hypothetical protein